jgi:muramidase (phage lysozyme)
MDIPAPARAILDFIRKTEVGDAGPAGYGVIYGHNQNRLPKPYTAMTVNEVIAAGTSWKNRFGSSASGGYQFMRDTLSGLKSEFGLSGNEVMSPPLQDQLGFALLKRRNYTRFINGDMSRADFARQLAQEWASFPVLVATKAPKRTVIRGQSFYAGDGLNKALVSAGTIEALLDRALALAGKVAPAGSGGSMDELEEVEQIDFRAVQLLLKNLGFDPGPIDGFWGPLTSAAVLLFQRRSGLPETGVLDATTLGKLQTNGPPRIDPQRAQEGEDDLLKKGSETIKLAKNGRLFGILTMIASALGFSGTQTNALNGVGATVNNLIQHAGGTVDKVADGVDKVVQSPAGEAFLPLLLKLGMAAFGASGGGLWVALAGLGFMVFRNSRAVAARRVEDHQQGFNIKF